MATPPVISRGATPTPPVPLTLRQQIQHHDSLSQYRSSQAAQLQLGAELVGQGRYDEALALLGPLWRFTRWREEGWWELLREVGALIRRAVEEGGRGVGREKADVVVGVGWEGMGRGFGLGEEKNGDGKILGLKGWLDGVGFGSVGERIRVVLKEQDVVSFLTTSFAFEKGEGKVGEGALCQLTVVSDADEGMEDAIMDEIKIVFEGGLRDVVLKHEKGKSKFSETGGIIHEHVELREESAHDPSKHFRLVGVTNLEFPSGRTKVFEFPCPLREPGEVMALSSNFSLAAKEIDLEYIVSFNRDASSDLWWHQKQRRKRLARLDPHAMTVLPKPPKMDMKFVDLEEQYYTDEKISLKLDVSNGEDDASIGDLEVRIVGDQIPAPKFVLRSTDRDPATAEADTETSTLSLGSIPRSGSLPTIIELPPSQTPAMYDMTLTLSYHLASEPETPISKTTTIRLFVVSPFESKCDFQPDYDPSPWPSIFTPPPLPPPHSPSPTNERADPPPPPPPQPTGLSQAWLFTTEIHSRATTALNITSIAITTLALNNGISLTTSVHGSTTPTPTPEEPVALTPKIPLSTAYTLLTRKLAIEDRHAASLDLALSISWQRDSHSTSIINITTLPIPRLLVASSEPRVLAVLSPAPPPPHAPAGSETFLYAPGAGPLHLSYVIENPSSHFLTFALSMAISDDFAFSGLKTGSVQLLPLSRRVVRVRILPVVREKWIWPVLVVRDRYFQKVLRVVPTGGLRGGKEGVGIWVGGGKGEEEGE